MVQHGRRLLPFAVKAAAALRTRDAHNLPRFLARESRGTIGLLFYLGQAVVPVTANLPALPVGALLA